MKNCEIGKSAKLELVVTEKDTAAALGSGLLEVFATPRMVALMEQTACAAVEEYLEEGESTVGTYIAVEHIAATPMGMKVTAEATVTACEGRFVTFTVTCHDEKELIGTAQHKRAVIKAERFLEKTYAKKQ